MPQQLYPRKEPWYPLKRRLGGHFGGVSTEKKARWGFWRKEQSFALPGFKIQILQPTA